MSSREESREFEALSSSACERPLSAEERARLELLLLKHERFRLEWLDQCRLHIELGLHHRAIAVTRWATQRIRRDEIQSPRTDTERRTKSPTRQRPARANADQQANPHTLVVAACLAASLLLVAFGAKVFIWPDAQRIAKAPAGMAPEVAQFRAATRRPEVVALARMHGSSEREAVEQALLAGAAMRFESGRAQVEMTGGAKLFVDGPAQVEFESPSHIRLVSGSLSAQLSEWSEEFVVDTKAMRLIDLGTTFRVTADPTSTADVQVLEGLVKIRPATPASNDLRGFLVGEGEAARVVGRQTLRARVTLDAAEVQERIRELSRLYSYQVIATNNTGLGLQEGEEDPYWRIAAAAPESGVSTPGYAVVCPAHRRYAVNEPDRSQWVSARQSIDGFPAETDYTFETTIDLTGFDHENVWLVGQILADNAIQEIRLNGQPVAIPESPAYADNQPFERHAFQVVEIKTGFVPGVNKVAIDVWNGCHYVRLGKKAQYKKKPLKIPNPMALRVEWQAFGRPLRIDGA